MPPRLARWRPPATLTSTRQPGTAIVALASGARRAGNLTAARPRHAPSPAAPCPRARRRSIPKSAQSYLSPARPPLGVGLARDSSPLNPLARSPRQDRRTRRGQTADNAAIH